MRKSLLHRRHKVNTTDISLIYASIYKLENDRCFERFVRRDRHCCLNEQLVVKLLFVVKRALLEVGVSIYIFIAVFGEEWARNQGRSDI